MPSGSLSDLLSRWVGAASAAAVLWMSAGALAVETPTPMPASPAASRPAVRPVTAETGAVWHELTPLQQDFLRPLQRDWPRIDAPQKRKWLVLTTRVPTMSGAERERIQTRMTEWAKLTPDQRGEARLRYQEAREVSAQDRQARWQAYQSLPPERRLQLAERASQAATTARRATAAGNAPAHEQPLAKSSIVGTPGLASQRRQVGPTLVQARPGATTTLITHPAAPPSHQQTGLPRIAATPEFVNKSTLLPRRGPQAATVRPAPAASAASAADGAARR